MTIPHVPAAAMSAPPLTAPAAHGATCPLCHTADPLSDEALVRGDDWRCERCGQLWDARRLATVASYAEWVRTH